MGKHPSRGRKQVKQQRGVTGTSGEEGKDEGRSRADLELGNSPCRRQDAGIEDELRPLSLAM